MTKIGAQDQSYLVWAIDDAPENLRMIQDSLLPDFASFVRVEVFSSAQGALEELQRRLPGRVDLPHILLMDYFLGTTYGTEVTRAVRLLFAPSPGPLVIGHSSMDRASRAIVEAGGDLVLPKRRGDRVSLALREALGSPERVEALLQAHGRSRSA